MSGVFIKPSSQPGYSRLFLSNTKHSPAFAVSSQRALLTETTYCLSSLSGDPVLGHSFIPADILLQDPACLLLPKQEAPASFGGASPNLQHAVKTTLEKHLSLLHWIYKCEFQSASISEFNKNSLQNSHSQPKKCLLPSTPYPLINPWLEATPNLRHSTAFYTHPPCSWSQTVLPRVEPNVPFGSEMGILGREPSPRAIFMEGDVLWGRTRHKPSQGTTWSTF